MRDSNALTWAPASQQCEKCFVMACLFYFFKIFSIFGYFIFSFYFIKNYGKGKKGLLSTKIAYFISYESLFSHKEEPDADLLDKGIVT